MRLCALIFVFLLVAGLVFAATAVENLQQRLSEVGEEKQPEILCELYDALIKTAPDTALNYAIQAEKLAIKHDLFSEAGKAKKQQGNYYYQRKDYVKAIQQYTSALVYAQKTSDDELIGDIYNNLGQSNAQIKKYALAQKYLQMALEKRKKLPTRDDEIATLNNLGQLYWQMDSYPKAALQYSAAAKHLEKTDNIKLASATYNNLGNAYVKTGNEAGALAAYIKSLELKEQFGTPSELASANLNLGNLFYATTNYAKATTHYSVALELAIGQKDSTGVAIIQRNLGAVQNALKNFDQALSYHLSSLAYFKKKAMKQDVARTLNSIGNLYQEQKKYSQALDYYQQSLGIKQSLKDLEGMAITYKNMGFIYVLIENYPLALQSTLSSIEISKELNDRLLLYDNYLQLSKIYGAMGEYKQGYQTFLELYALDAALYKKEGQNALAEMMARFDVYEKNKEITVLKDTHIVQAKKLAKAAKDMWLIALLFIIVMGVALTLYVFYRLKQREVKKRKAVQVELENLNRELEERVSQEVAKYDKQQQVLIQKSKLESLGNLAAGIAHEINQPLSSISMSMDNILYKAQRGIATPEYLNGKGQNIQGDIERIRQIIEQVRMFSRDQKDSILEQVDVNMIVTNSIAITKSAFIKSGIALETSLHEISPKVIGNSFKLEQVIVNLMSNAKDAILEKQARNPEAIITGNISISTSICDENVVITVADNGIGIPSEKLNMIFDPFYTTKSPDKGTGLGLSISFGIIRDMGGSVSATSIEGESTTIAISLPILNNSVESGNTLV